MFARAERGTKNVKIVKLVNIMRTSIEMTFESAAAGANGAAIGASRELRGIPNFLSGIATSSKSMRRSFVIECFYFHHLFDAVAEIFDRIRDDHDVNSEIVIDRCKD